MLVLDTSKVSNKGASIVQFKVLFWHIINRGALNSRRSVMRKPICKRAILYLVLLMIPVSFAASDSLFSMNDINASLEMEYQSQLVLQPQTKRRVQPRKATVKKPPVRHQAQQRITPSPVRQPAAKAPVPEELFEAATNGNVNIITSLLQQGINVNSANSERETSLHMAAANGRYPAVIYLLNHGANIHARTTKNWLPIHHATRFRKANIANYLMKKGASPHARTSDGLSAIDMARTLRDQQILRILGAK